MKPEWFDNWTIDLVSADPQVWLHGLFLQASYGSKFSILLKKSSEVDLFELEVFAMLCQISSPSCQLCVCLCVSLHLSVYLYGLACAWLYLCLFDWEHLDDSIEAAGRTQGFGWRHCRSALVRVRRLWSPCPVRLPDRWTLFAQRTRHAMSPGCHSNSAVSLSCKEWNNRSISCITKEAWRVWLEGELPSFHVVVFSHFYSLSLFCLLAAAQLVHLPVSHFLFLCLSFSLCLLFPP